MADARVGPREEWDEYPLRGSQWPEPEADYEALGYPETEVGHESEHQAVLRDLMVSMLHECLTLAATIKNNDVDTDNG